MNITRREWVRVSEKVVLHYYLYSWECDIGGASHLQYVSYEGVMGHMHLSASTPPILKSGA